jgi:hypothetical protein
MQNLTRSGVAVGWYGQRSIELGFVPHFWVLPHVHGLLVVPRSLSPSEAQDLYRRFVHTYDSAPYGRVLFPDLHLSPIETQQELNNWLVYILRPLDLAKPYKDAVRSGVDLGWLHEQIDDFTQGGDQVLRETTSPRKGGCLRVNGANYLGTGITNTTRRNDQKATTGEVTAAAAGSKNGQLASNCAWRESERRIRIAAVAFADDDE